MSQSSVALGGVRIGIEAEFLLQTNTLEEDSGIPNLETFAFMIAASYVDDAPEGFPGMREEVEMDIVDSEEDEIKFKEWVLAEDKSIEPAAYDPNVSPRQCIYPFRYSSSLHAKFSEC
jgi:hypothetical protein